VSARNFISIYIFENASLMFYGIIPRRVVFDDIYQALFLIDCFLIFSDVCRVIYTPAQKYIRAVKVENGTLAGQL
jgi:hypothetical protein